MASDFLPEAIRYAEVTPWSILPIRNNPRTGRKAPACRSWKQFQARRPTLDELAQLFQSNTVTGLAAICGSVSDGLWGRDFDKPQAYDRWAEAHPDLAHAMPTHRTGRGFHVVGCWPGVPFRQFQDGELLGEGHYVVLPHSIHLNGGRYEWTEGRVLDLLEIDPRVAHLDRA